MFDEQDGFTLNDLGRRLANIIRIGTIFEIDFEIAKSRVKIGDIETNWLPWVNSNSGANNSWNPPEIDEQVVILSPSGELNQAVILPSLYKSNASSNLLNIQSITYKDGSKVTFDHDVGNLTLDIKGNTTIKVTGNAEIEAANITLKGNTDLGGSGGDPVARVGDKVEITAGSSAGEWPIISGSSKVKAT
jgi:phage baseplate assembly protein V